MAQSDYELAAHVSGLNQRTEINSIFDSILTHNSGSTAPTVTKAFMMWVDTSNATYYYLKMRNHDNTAWVTLGIYTVATKTYTSYAEDTVKLTENQTIDGVKTFSSSPIVPTPTTGDNSTKVATTAWSKLGLAYSVGASGYIKLPDWLGGLIIQWGNVSITINTTVTITTPIAVINANYIVLTTNNSITTQDLGENQKTGGKPLSKTQIEVRNGATTGQTRTFNWISIGS